MYSVQDFNLVFNPASPKVLLYASPAPPFLSLILAQTTLLNGNMGSYGLQPLVKRVAQGRSVCCQSDSLMFGLAFKENCTGIRNRG